jgi:hypothetical protein
MEDFFNTFYKGYNNTDIPNYTINLLEYQEYERQKNRVLSEDHYVSDPVKNKIKEFNNCYKIECLSKLQKNFYPYTENSYMPCIEIYYFTKNKANKNNINNIKIKINPLIRRIFFISNLYSKLSKDSTPLKCIICPTILKKKIPSNKIVLGPNNVNSGLSIPSHREIVIWREEELNKVLTHELIHTFKLDEMLYETNDIKKYIYNTLNISKNTEINPNEAYTEALTILLNTIFNIVDLNNKNKNNKNNNNKNNNNKNNKNSYQYKKYVKQINDEIDFSIKQASKILIYNSYSSFDELISSKNNTINSNNKNKKNNNKWKQESNVLSYYILKIAILYNLNDFFKYLKTTDNLYINNTNNFIRLLDKSLNNKDFINKINNTMINQENKNNLYKRQMQSPLSKNTLRMSYY